IPRVGQRLAARTGQPIRRLVGLIQLHSQWIAAQQRSEWLTTGSLVDPSELPSAKCPFRQSRPHFGCGHFPGEVGNKRFANIEIRQAAGCALVKEKRIEKSVRICVVGYRGGERIDTLAPSVCAAKLDAMAHALRNDHLQSLIKRISLPEHA